MSTSIILLDQNFNANYVDIMVFEPFCLISVLFPPAAIGGIDDMVHSIFYIDCQLKAAHLILSRRKFALKLRPFMQLRPCSKREFLLFWTTISKNFFARSVETAVKTIF